MGGEYFLSGLRRMAKKLLGMFIQSQSANMLNEPGLRSVLVVDDEESIRKLLCHVLTPAGYIVLEAKDGKEAIRLVNSHSVDVVITDLAMPEQEGIETVRALRRSHPNLKVIAMSGAFGDQLKIVRMLGAHAAIRKPFHPAGLCQLVEQILKG